MNPVVPMSSVAPVTPVTSMVNPSTDPRQRSYQDLKARVHTDLLNRLNLERLTQMGQKEAEPEIRRIILEIIERSSETTPLCADRTRNAGRRRPQRTVRPGSSRSAAARSEHLGHPGQPLRSGVRRARWPARADRRPLSRRPPPACRSSSGSSAPSAGASTRSSPMVDARLRDGSRVNAIIPPLAIDGPSLSIRRFRTGRVGARRSGRTRDT